MATATRQLHTTSQITAKDGTTIGYRQLGHGPGLLLLHGAMSSSQNHLQLAEFLSESFTVYIVDRRGRGLSGAFSKEYSIQSEVDDLDTFLTHTGAHTVFGVSSGAIVCLTAALTLPAVERAVIFEPPLFPNDSEPINILTNFDREISQGRIAAALVTSMKGGQMGPAIFNIVPNWLLEPLVNMGIKSEDKQTEHPYVPMRELAPLLHYDFQLVVEMSGKTEHFSAINAEVLLLGGSKSPAYLKSALGALKKVLPHVKRIELPGLNHSATWNSDLRGKPEAVAQAVLQYFAS